MIASKQMTKATTYQEQMCKEHENNYKQNKQQNTKNSKYNSKRRRNFDITLISTWLQTNMKKVIRQKRVTNRTTGSTKDGEAGISASLLA